MQIIDTKKSQRIIRFLLGEMPDEERAAFEDEYLRDNDFFHHVVEIENDMMDLCALGTLSESEQKRFERSFLAYPKRRKRLSFARALMGYAEQNSELQVQPGLSATMLASSWFQSRAMLTVAAAVLFALIIARSWLFTVNRRLKADLHTLQEQEASASQKTASLQHQIEDLNKALEARNRPDQQSGPGPATSDFASFILAADALRGSGKVPNLAILPNKPYVRLEVVFPTDVFTTYQVFVETASGSHVWHEAHATARTLDSRDKEIIVKLPSRVLKPGDYVLRLTARNGQDTEDVAGYSFRVSQH